MKNRRGVFQFSVLTRRPRPRREQFPEFLSNRHQLGKILHIFSRTRILNYGHRRRTPRRRRNLAVHFAPRLFHKSRNLADLRFHRSPSSPLISSALSPPTRACTRAPVVITRASRISSARGASFTPTSMASK